MNLDITVSMDTCFYYLAQAISGWNIYSPEAKSYRYYQHSLNNVSESQQHSIDAIKAILEMSLDPRRVLAELYTGNHDRDEAKQITELARLLRDLFAPIWQESLSELEIWARSLKKMRLKSFTPSMQQIVNFLGATSDPPAPPVSCNSRHICPQFS